MEAYDEAMQHGHGCLGIGSYTHARDAFTRAFDLSNTDRTRAAALQMRGIAHRLTGKYGSAHRDFDAALALVTRNVDDPHRSLAARIQRDKGLCFLSQAKENPFVTAFGASAKGAFLDSFHTLQDLSEVVEAAVSLQCLGLYYDFVGNKKEALSRLRRGERLLRGKHPVYEMNGLVRIAQVSSFWRWCYILRAFYLGIRFHNNRAKLVEYGALLIGGERLQAATLRART